MVKITEELIRKRAEHNEGLIGSLEELSLHQEDIEHIEHINNWCKDIQILYFQSNLIPKIENLNKLKKLEYLNLAINNIERIENLERCESLAKLDLTLNFIGDLQSVCSLRENRHLTNLYLTGNPCCDYPFYREYVIVKLPQLQWLDSTEITKSQRIKAMQVIEKIEKKIRLAEEEYNKFRNEQKQRVNSNKNRVELSDEEFWKSTSENCPEARVEMATRSRKAKKLDEKDQGENKRIVSLFNKQGRPLNVNQAKLNFKFSDEHPEKYVLDLAVYKYLDTNLIEVDLQPIYVKVGIKGKVFQFVLPEEILVDKSTAKRSQTTGHLLIEMPRANYQPLKIKVRESKKKNRTDCSGNSVYLEVDDEKKLKEMDFSKIVENNSKIKRVDDNPEVPPLEFVY